MLTFDAKIVLKTPLIDNNTLENISYFTCVINGVDIYCFKVIV